MAEGRRVLSTVTDPQQQHRTNEAAEQFTDALAQSYKTLAERGVGALEQGAQATEVFYKQTINNLHTQAEENRRATQQLAEQHQRQADAVQSLAQESVEAYRGFVDSLFSYWEGVIQAAERGTREAE
jgi:predicted nucleic acid-binding protein